MQPDGVAKKVPVTPSPRLFFPDSAIQDCNWPSIELQHCMQRCRISTGSSHSAPRSTDYCGRRTPPGSIGRSVTQAVTRRSANSGSSRRFIATLRMATTPWEHPWGEVVSEGTLRFARCHRGAGYLRMLACRAVARNRWIGTRIRQPRHNASGLLTGSAQPTRSLLLRDIRRSSLQ